MRAELHQAAARYAQSATQGTAQRPLPQGKYQLRHRKVAGKSRLSPGVDLQSKFSVRLEGAMIVRFNLPVQITTGNIDSSACSALITGASLIASGRVPRTTMTIKRPELDSSRSPTLCLNLSVILYCAAIAGKLGSDGRAEEDDSPSKHATHSQSRTTATIVYTVFTNRRNSYISSGFSKCGWLSKVH